MKIAVIIPDRGDRPEFLENCLRMIKTQTLQPENIYLANWEPKSKECDITERYRTAYHSFDGMDYDCILLMENDDWYSEDYIKTMVCGWVMFGEPDIFGTNYTYYYHIGLKKHTKLVHLSRASAMNTLIKPDLKIKWPVDNYPYTDIALWQQLKGVTFSPETPISIGIKHGIGLGGGHYHNTKLERYDNDDSEFKFLESIMDNESLTFYKGIHEKIQSNF